MSRRTLPLAGLALLISASCQPHSGQSPESASGPRVAPAPADIARQLARSGDHLAASRYWEAALANGAQERDALPALIATEIRAGRLRAALANVRRLEELAPERPAVAELRTLLRTLLAGGEPEGRR